MPPLKIMATTVGAALLVWGLLFAYASSPAWAADITVNSLADDADGADGECTLREAITAANTDTTSGTATGECAAGSGADVINIGVSGTVNLSGVLPDLSSNIEIKGPGADQFTVRRDSGGDYRIFTVSNTAAVVTISGITISNGNIPGDQGVGGGIRKNQGDLTVANTTISGNTAAIGGGIYSFQGDLTVTNSTISGNAATLTGGNLGGGIFSDTSIHGVTTITNSTISGNTAGRWGGGVYNSGGLTVIDFSTITNNTAQVLGAGGGVAGNGNGAARIEVLSTIISANQGTDVEFVFFFTNNPFVSKGYNLIGGGNGTGAFNQTGDQVGVTDPKLDPLGSYGGPTQTHRLQSDSPAIDAGPPTDGDPTACPPPDTDQRGVSRPQGSACDIGAFELESTSTNSPPTAVDDSATTNEDNSVTINVLANDADPDGDALTVGSVTQPTNGSAVLNSDNTVTYTPKRDFNGIDTFTYTISDAEGETTTATVTVTVNAVNDAPTIEVVGGPDSTCLSDTSARTTLKITDVDNDPSSLTLSADSSNPALVPNSNVTFAGSGDTRTATFTTISNRASSTVTIMVSDGQASATTTVNVRAGGSGTDNLIGTNEADILLAQSGNDTLSGLEGSDVLCGASGNDNLTGGEGADHLGGGSGNDTLTGGLGADHFGGDSGTDTATDFNLGEGDTRSSIE
jgi:CSLREA domain-containing protein